MIFYSSVLDGFKVILGHFTIHLAALIVLAAVAHPPGFPCDASESTCNETDIGASDTTREKDAVAIYVQLIVFHLFGCVTTYLMVYLENTFVELPIIAFVFLICIVI